MPVLSEPSFDAVPERAADKKAQAHAPTGRFATGQRGIPEKGASVTPMGTRRGISQPEDAHRTRPARRPFLVEHDFLLVTSEDNVPWRFQWDRKTYDLLPGQTLPMPFPAVVNAMGDPRSVVGETIKYQAETGERGVVVSRYETLAALFARYGIREENVTALVEFAPKISAKAMTGEPVVFPAQNPTMAPWPVPTTPEPGREQPIDQRSLVEEMRAENAAMRSELDRLHDRLNERLGGDAAGSDDGEPDLSGALLSGAPADEGPRTRI